MEAGDVGDLEAEAPCLFVAGVRSGTGDDGARGQRHRREHGDTGGVAADLGRHRADRHPVVGLPGAVDEHHGVGDEHQ